MNIRSHGPDLDSIGNDAAFGFFWPGVCSVSLTRFDSTTVTGHAPPDTCFMLSPSCVTVIVICKCFDTRESAHDTRSFRLFVPPIVHMSDCSNKTMFNRAVCSIFVLVFCFLVLFGVFGFPFFCCTFSSTLKVKNHTLVLLVFGFSLDFSKSEKFQEFPKSKKLKHF